MSWCIDRHDADTGETEFIVEHEEDWFVDGATTLVSITTSTAALIALTIIF